MEEAQCASCHRKIDPIGSGLENFDPIGKWRELEHTGATKGKRKVNTGAGRKIDTPGAFHKGSAFADHFAMRELIADREEDFAEYLVGCALGRPFGFTDEDLANGIVAAAKEQDYTVSVFIHALVMSEPFQRK